MLDTTISDFLLEHPECYNAYDIVGHCYIVSAKFVTHCESRGINVKLILLMDYVGKPFDTLHDRWKGEDFLVHCVALIGEDTYDFTRRQFEASAPVPFIQSVDQLKKDWETISREHPLTVSLTVS